MKYHILIAGVLIALLLVAGCSDEVAPDVSTPVPATPAPDVKYVAGDIIAKTATQVEPFWLIIRYTKSTDKYDRATVYRKPDGSYYRKDNKTDSADRAIVEKANPARIGHVDSVAAVQILTVTVTPTRTATLSGPEPVISGITPGSGTAGFSVSITNLAGSNFQTGATVKLVGTDGSSVTGTNVVIGEKTISCTFNLYDLKAGKFDVVVTNPDGQSDTLVGGFTVIDAGPVVSGITPSEGIIGQALDLTISGSSFKDPAKVIFHKGSSQFDCMNTKVTSATQITCYLPAIPSGTLTGYWDIEVKNIQDKQNGTAASKFNIKNATAS